MSVSPVLDDLDRALLARLGSDARTPVSALATTLGVASGAVAGAVAITPACGFVTPVGALVIGLAAGAICSLAIGLKYRFGFDDSLDVVGVHLVGGLVGTLLIGFFATDAYIADSKLGLFYGGGLDQLWRQAAAAGAVMIERWRERRPRMATIDALLEKRP